MARLTIRRSPVGDLVALLLLLVCFRAFHDGKQSSGPTAYLRDRMALSVQAWQRSIERRMTMAKNHKLYPRIPFFPQRFAESPFTIWDFFSAAWSCPHDIERIGCLGDGGKWVCGMSVYESLPAPTSSTSPQDGLVVYSFGVSEDSSFEAELLQRAPSARVWGYDFSVKDWGYGLKDRFPERTFFKQVGLGGKDKHGEDPPFWTLASVMQSNGHEYIDILKMDVESFEFDVLDAFVRLVEDTRTVSGDGVLPIGQILMELHPGNGTHLLTEHDGREMDFTRLRTWRERLEELGMRPTWMEMNLLSMTLHDERRNPDCAEYVWVNAKDERSVLWK